MKVMGSVTVDDVTVDQAGMGRIVSTQGPAHCQLRRAPGSARAALTCLVLEGVSEANCHVLSYLRNNVWQMNAILMHLM